MPDAERWHASQLRMWLRERFELSGAVLEACRWLDAGFTVAVYECPAAAGKDGPPAILLPFDHATPLDSIPYTDGRVRWPMQLRAVCRPVEDNVLPLRAAAEGTG